MNEYIFIKEVEIKAVYWDGSFRQAEKIGKLLEGFRYTTSLGQLVFVDKENDLQSVPRASYVLRDGDEVFWARDLQGVAEIKKYKIKK